MREVFDTVIMVAGGLGLFLFGMKIMSSGLEIVAGNRLQHILHRATANKILAVIVGIVATIGINSSTAVTIMTVSFVNSGLMNLKQAIGIIMGANVGTTFSAQLVAFRIDAVAPLFIFFGTIMYLFFKKRSVKNIGYIILGFGVLFFGVTVMGTPLRALADEPSFNAMLASFQNPFLALLTGFIFTAIVQSSSATMGLLVTMHLAGVPISFETSAFIILGTNIGTSITTLIASIPANRESKRAASFHILFDIIGSTVFGLLIFFVPSILHWFQATWSDSARQVAMFHTLYNFATLFLLLPFTEQLVKLVSSFVPNGDSDEEKEIKFLDWNLIDRPQFALTAAHSELLRMADLATENVRLAVQCFLQKDEELLEKVIKQEARVNRLEKEIVLYLADISQKSMGGRMTIRHAGLLHAANDIERVSDHARNIAYTAEKVIEEKVSFTEDFVKELMEMYVLVGDILEAATNSARDNDPKTVATVRELEEKIDAKELALKDSNLKRMLNGDMEAGLVFFDIISNFERIGDHATNLLNLPQGRL